MDETTAKTANLYQEWARVEAHGSSPIYERLALAVAQDPAALALLSQVEPVKRQPNLLFGALRWHDVNVEDPAEALAWLREHQDAVLAVLRTRRTQTNEVARCATFLPALALLPQPLALIEVGASAGLCLLYDSWRYHYTGIGVDHWVGLRIVAGDLTDDLAKLLDQAPTSATVVVTHSATLAYLEQDERNAFIKMLAESGVHRLGSEGRGVLPQVTRQIPDKVDIKGRFVVSLDDRALALAQPHGRSLTWL